MGYIWALEVYNVLQMYVSKATWAWLLCVVCCEACCPSIHFVEFLLFLFFCKTKTRTKEKENASPKKTAEEANGSGVLFPTHDIVICREPAGNSRTLWMNGWIQRSCFK